MATYVASQMDLASPDAANLASAYQSGFLTASILMVVMIVPAFFLTNKLASKVSSKQEVV
ncbi:hypothetical protein [Paenibacillus sp. Soil766]|uniref:hypothetical protein n=1 Tax=Paenibacillus sp. Soil766 TaxID=1736404 RepID=UPI0012FC36E2|nr:hypothetical protein [Paenibacillus sp. Soil766]